MVLIAALVGGGIYVIQNRGVFGASIFKQSELSKSLKDLEQIARLSHDYLNGYICGSDWGTALPEDAMKEEANSLQSQFEIVHQSLVLLYSDDKLPTALLEDFRNGFGRLQEGLAGRDMTVLKEAHKIFEKIDYGYFHHKWGDDVNLRS